MNHVARTFACVALKEVVLDFRAPPPHPLPLTEPLCASAVDTDYMASVALVSI